MTTIGWREWLALPELDIPAVKAKIDTGARTSSLHAFDIETTRRGGRRYIRFSVHPLQRDNRKTVHCEAPLEEERWVRSSNGKRELRPVIRTTMRIKDLEWVIELTLASRDAMGFRMLLGREAVRGRCLVDAGRSYVIGKRRRKSKKKRRRLR
jgi:hypothetical protein